MDTQLFRKFTALAYDRAGLYLGAGKEALVEARVARRQSALGIDTAAAYLEYLEAGDTDEVLHFLDAITTNFTSFFREPEHFKLLVDAMRHSADAGQKRFRLWSAASSTGEEPYTMAMSVLEGLGSRDLDWKILATDLSRPVLARAEAGTYSESALRPVSESQLRKYFTRERGGEEGEPMYTVRPELRVRVVFKRMSLAAPPFPMKGPIDFIFCRNVMIYFDNHVRSRLIHDCERLLCPGGYLVTGHSETLTGITTGLSVVAPSIYRKRGAP